MLKATLGIAVSFPLVLASSTLAHPARTREGRAFPVQRTESSNILISQRQSATDSSDIELERELARELGGSFSGSQPDSSMSKISSATRAARRSTLQSMNPNISVIGTVLGTASTMESLDRNVDLRLQEGEFSFQAAVDPYAKADFYVAFGRHSHSDLVPGSVTEAEEAHTEEDGLSAEIEEAYVTFLSLPFSSQLKLGKFRSRFGKLNEMHPHAYNFVDVPLMYENFFGPEGLNDEGASLSLLLPNKAFFLELTFQVTGGPAENISFTRADNNHLLYLAHLKNFFDLNDNTTLEFGVSGLTGPNDTSGETTRMLAADLTLKWKPLQNRRKSFELMSEFLVSDGDNDVAEVTSFGLFAFARYQLARRWFAGALFDYSEFPQVEAFNRKAYSGIVQHFVSEFQKIEFQYKFNDSNFFDSFSEFRLRAVFVIGAHGAHQY